MLYQTENIQELVALYSIASLFFNPTYEDNFPTTNIEALACGTPILTYDTGGSPEAVLSPQVGRVIKKDNTSEIDIPLVKNAIEEMIKMLYPYISEENRDTDNSLTAYDKYGKDYTVRLRCREESEKFDMNHRLLEYISVYESLKE